MCQLEMPLNPAPAEISRTARVGLFVTCLVDLFRPVVGLAALHLLEEAGFEPDIPRAQGCCGMTAHICGDEVDAADFAKRVVECFELHDHVVVPSLACARMIHSRYRALLCDDPIWSERAALLSEKTHELSQFLHCAAGIEHMSSEYRGTAVLYMPEDASHNAYNVRAVRTLLSSIKGLDLKPDLVPATHCDRQTLRAIIKSGAGTVLGDDIGHMMTLASALKQEGSAIEVRHIAEVLANMADSPAIGARGTKLHPIPS